MSALDLKVLTPTRQVVKASCAEVYLPVSNGEIGILPDHAPLITTLGPGVVRFQNQRLAVRSGFVQVLENKIILLADEAVRPEEVKAWDLQTKQTELEDRMISADVAPEERAVAALELTWIKAQLFIAG